MNSPRLQLRWEEVSEEVEKEFAIEKEFNVEGLNRWICHYELVLPLRESDVRRDFIDSQGQEAEREELVIAIKEPTLRRTRRIPCFTKEGEPFVDTPYRDGAHAQWDSALLGGLPIYVIAPTGESFEVQDR